MIRKTHLFVMALGSFCLMGQPLSAMQIFIKNLQGKSTAIEVEEDESVAELKEKIHEREGVPVAQQRLIYNGKQLEDEKSLREYSVRKESVIHVVLRLQGGSSL